ncbi:protein FAM124A-like [Megalops cyprinoides]|uniref:protein FAM124A-like n=1 Tax=Megalops cyprinoides TaxID=118141 RepID=UPI00186555C4|nr:protein FAM124A-like [Megalops cyprinoides]
MEKNSTEDECVDSGAETGGSDYSPMSSANNELFMGDLQDPFLVSVHIITDPGQAKLLQRAADSLLAWIHPELQLFRVSERGAWQQRHKRARPSSGPQREPLSQPALAVILFLQEEYGGEEQILRLHHALQRPPWRYHHTERVNGRLLPLVPCSQDFFTLAPGTPLWAVRQVHYGKEIVRFTVYCRHDTFPDMVSMYRLLLQRQLAQRREDFCFFVIYSNPDTEIQLSFKRLPRGQSPAPTESAIMEFRVRDVGGLVPLLPRPCTPISEVRWQTEDYDGNKILLQVRGSSRYRRRHTIAQFTNLPSEPKPVPSPTPLEPAPASSYGRGPATYRNRRYHRTSPHPRHQAQMRGSQQDLPCACKEDEAVPHRDPEAARAWWAGHHTRSLFCLPTSGGFQSSSSSPARSRRSSLIPPFRLNVDTLVGAEETDVDTGQKMDSGTVDLSVVSAYSRPLFPLSRPLSTPARDSPSFPGLSRGSTSTLGRNALLRSSHSASAAPPVQPQPRPHSACLPLGSSNSGHSKEAEHSSLAGAQSEEEQEFYI